MKVLLERRIILETSAFVNLAGGLGLLLYLSLGSLSMHKLGFKKIGNE